MKEMVVNLKKKERKIWFRGGNIRGNDVILTQKVKEIK